MKKIVLATMAALILTAAQAQDNRRGQRPQQKGDHTEMMVKELGLDSKQAAALKKLNEKYADAFRHGPHPGGPRGPRPDGARQGEKKPDAKKPDANTGATAQQPPKQQREGDRAKGMEQHRKQMEAYDKELQGILTKQQYEQYTKKREEMRNRRPQRHGAPQGEKK